MQVSTRENSLTSIFTNRKLLLLKSCLVISLIYILFYTYTLAAYSHLKSDEHETRNIRKILQDAVANIFPQKNSSFNERHLILLWTPYFRRTNWLPSTSDLHCPIDKCDVTSDRHRYNESSAVILHWRDINPKELPFCSPEDNKVNCPLIVVFNKEAPPNTHESTIEEINDKIHWTVTYRKDSDIIAPYGKLEFRKQPISMPEIKLNRKSVCWLVSNCNTASNREIYVAGLEEYIPVEIYGKCGNSSCPKEDTFDCYKWLSDRCRFYLSFENSICKDYSTEKLYYPLMTDMVPIVMGGDDYARYLPPNSFINVNNFSSPETLAKYLRVLIEDDTKYLSYFRWKRKYMVQNTSYKWLCDVCEKLHSTKLSDVTPHQDFITWWYAKANCEYGI